MFLNIPSWFLPFGYDETRQDAPPSFGRDSQVNSEHPAQNKRMCVCQSSTRRVWGSRMKDPGELGRLSSPRPHIVALYFLDTIGTRVI